MLQQLTLAACALASTHFVASAQAPARPIESKPALKVGMAAPALSIEKWVKGSPLASFEKGKVYVVEFWATWCGPCIAGMPHLSSLQREFGSQGLTIVGVTSTDSRNDLPAVEKMVADKGEGMGYTVAWDSGRKTNEAYMSAAGRNGIPCSFLVDGQGRVAFIGHPMFLDVPIKEVLAGKWDIEKDNAIIQEAESTLGKLYGLAAKDPKAALEKLAEFEAKHPSFAGLFESLKFSALLGTGDFPAAYAVAGKLVDHAIAAKDAMTLNAVAWQIVDPTAGLAQRDLDLALRAAEKAVAFTAEKDATILDTLARVWFTKGDAKKAIEIQTRAVELAKGSLKKSLEMALAEYRGKGAQ